MMATAAPQSELIVVGNTQVANAYGVPKDATILLERNVFATMRDGARLAANVFRPAAAGKYPVLMHMAHTGKDRFTTRHPGVRRSALPLSSPTRRNRQPRASRALWRRAI